MRMRLDGQKNGFLFASFVPIGRRQFLGFGSRLAARLNAHVNPKVAENTVGQVAIYVAGFSLATRAARRENFRVAAEGEWDDVFWAQSFGTTIRRAIKTPPEALNLLGPGTVGFGRIGNEKAPARSRPAQPSRGRAPT
jgi:hypothetical protein